MTLAINLRKAARNLIDTFGNSASVYTYSSATKTDSNEGDVVVSSWGTATTISVVDGENIKSLLIQADMGRESIGEDEKVARDDATIAVNDRITVDSVEYRVVELRSVRTQDTLIIQVVRLTKVTGTTNW